MPCVACPTMRPLSLESDLEVSSTGHSLSPFGSILVSVTSKHCQLTTRVAACTRAGHPGPGRPCLLHWRTVHCTWARRRCRVLRPGKTLWGPSLGRDNYSVLGPLRTLRGPGQAHIYWSPQKPYELCSSGLDKCCGHCEPEKPYGAPYPRPGHTHMYWALGNPLASSGFLLCRPAAPYLGRQ